VAQIVAEELGLDPQNLLVEEGDTDTAPYGLGTYASRSTPVAGAALAMAARRVRERGRKVAAHLAGSLRSRRRMERLQVQRQRRSRQERHDARSRLRRLHQPRTGQRTGPRSNVLLRSAYLTFPFGAYVAVVDVDRETGETKVRRFVALDDCARSSTR